MKREVVCGEGEEKNFCNNRCYFFAIGDLACFSLCLSTIRKFRKAIAIVHETLVTGKN